MLKCSSLRTNVVATSKASVYTVPIDKILSTPGWSSASTFVSFTTNLLMLIRILQKMFENCRLGYYCVIDTLRSVLCCRIWILHSICYMCAVCFDVIPQCLVTDRIPIKLQLTGKSRLIFKFSTNQFVYRKV